MDHGNEYYSYLSLPRMRSRSRVVNALLEDFVSIFFTGFASKFKAHNLNNCIVQLSYPLLRRRRIHTMASIQCVLELKPRLIPSLSNLSLEYTVRLPSVLCSRMYLLCKGFLILVSQSYFYGQ